MTKTKRATRNLGKPVPIKLTPALEKKIEAAGLSTGLKKSDIMRMAVERGVDVLLAQLNGESPASQPAA